MCAALCVLCAFARNVCDFAQRRKVREDFAGGARMSLSVCFLTRNEEETIGQAVRSVAAVADEILVVDTHSHDRTAARAAEAGARVLQFDWNDDFSAGRNFA